MSAADFDLDDNPFGATGPQSAASSDFDDFLGGDSKAAPLQSIKPVGKASSPAIAAIIEDTPLSKWQAEHRTVMQTRMARASQTKRELSEVARNELENNYVERKQKIAKVKLVNREDEKSNKEQMEAVMESGSDWEKVSKYCDLAPKSKESRDVARIRTLLIELKNEKSGSASSSSAVSKSTVATPATAATTASKSATNFLDF